MMNEIKIEFLRHGPAHNQLLSPLTRYLAVCGDHEAVSVTIPMEHDEVVQDLSVLGSQSASQRSTEADLKERMVKTKEVLLCLGGKMGEVLSQVPGLVAELHADCKNESPIAQLRLVLSANELAMLPFEIAAGGAGMPGAGQHLSLQSTLPLCITREIRHSHAPSVAWPSDCKILFVTSGPSGLPENLMKAHLLALREAVDPWVFHGSKKRGPDSTHEVRKRLDILTNATAKSLTEKMATEEFSHVHILAHGAQLTDSRRKRFGIKLMDGVIDGERLALALRPRSHPGIESMRSPTMVTLSTCDGGNVGDIVASGASVAHDLHRAGIPFVVASQFPLSFLGSVHLARLLYRPLLDGKDPRLVIDNLRRQLKTLVPQHHDWAGLVVYALLPPRIEETLPELQFQRAKARIECAMSHLDGDLPINHFTEFFLAKSAPTPRQGMSERLKHRFATAHAMLESLLGEANGVKPQISGLLASAEKRYADGLLRDPKHDETRQSPAGFVDAEIDNYLYLSAAHYLSTFEANSGSSWALVQYLVIQVGTGLEIKREDWDLGYLLSQKDVDHADPIHRVWALSNLLELSVIAQTPGLLGATERKKHGKLAAIHLRAILKICPIHDQRLEALRRQLKRYTNGLFCKMDATAKELARQLSDILNSGQTEIEPQED